MLYALYKLKEDILKVIELNITPPSSFTLMNFKRGVKLMFNE